jgi:hypothetical protein
MLCRRESLRFAKLSRGYFNPMDLMLRLKPCTSTTRNYWVIADTAVQYGYIFLDIPLAKTPRPLYSSQYFELGQ